MEQINVCCLFRKDGIVIPKYLAADNGTIYPITVVKHTCQSEYRGLTGTRFTILLGRNERYLYRFGNRWYIEHIGGN